ncbi:hypothetical protein BN59_00868 [Legionella massiliensis]|uniref:Uncharacterized protein n=1 Tax=Legionella massiliensis TaxID=1034943 RepID=A0A078KXX1_9GAMM|nr:hypothetical protein [Legionella massiliensis]CDZ76594.1 hypothetical protein BN59_00868 [Legionella massiliensis]CEE12332.1 hypothetical protein BN1094_00868 [Legionella massiliensis]
MWNKGTPNHEIAMFNKQFEKKISDAKGSITRAISCCKEENTDLDDMHALITKAKSLEQKLAPFQQLKDAWLDKLSNSTLLSPDERMQLASLAFETKTAHEDIARQMIELDGLIVTIVEKNATNTATI